MQDIEVYFQGKRIEVAELNIDYEQNLTNDLSFNSTYLFNEPALKLDIVGYHNINKKDVIREKEQVLSKSIEDLSKGDSIRITRCDCGEILDEIGIVSKIDDMKAYLSANLDCYCEYIYPKDAEYTIFNKNISKKGNSLMSSISNKIKDLTLSPTDRKLRKHGLEDDCGNLTDEGQKVLLNHLWNNNKAVVVNQLKDIEKEEKEEEKESK